MEQCLPLLRYLGFTDAALKSRQLVLRNVSGDRQLFILRGRDALTCVRYGVADIAIVGKDMLLEYGSEGVYELLYTNLARCRLVLAGIRPPPKDSHLRVATKYTKMTNQYCIENGWQAEIIPIYGSAEISPLIGIADYIVDITASGKTLQANNLNILATIADISARVVINAAALHTKHQEIQQFKGHVISVIGSG